MRISILIFLLSVLPLGQILAQETNRHQYSRAPESSRYEIVQSELMARVTLKIDKYLGSIYQLAQGSKGLTWQLIQAEDHSQDEIVPNQANYQVFTSGLTVRMTYLINVNTGATWQLTEDSNIGFFWDALY